MDFITLADDAIDCKPLSCLPVTRWADTIGGLTTRTDGLSNIDPFKAIGSIPVTLESLLLAAGNGLWALTAWLQSVFSSSSSKVLDTFGSMMNSFAGAFYKGFSGGGSFALVGLICIVAIVPGLWDVTRGRGARMLMRKCGAVILGLSLFITMGVVSDRNPDKPAVGTPWWMAKTTVSVLGDVGGGVGQELLASYDSSGQLLAKDYSTSATGDLLSCRNYLNELHRSDETTRDSKNTVLSALNTMWEETGLRLWSRAQYGAGENAGQVFCRIPEYRAGVDPSDMANLTNNAIRRGGGSAAFPSDALAFNPNWWNPKIKNDDTDADNDGKTLDRWMTMWDTCGYGKQSKRIITRKGWGWVNDIGGSNRGVDPSGKASSEHQTMFSQCAAALAGDPNGAAGTPTQDIKDLRVPKYKTKDELSMSDAMKSLVNKFNITTNSSWKAVALSYVVAQPLDAGEKDATAAQVNEAINTLNQQHGDGGISDVAGALLFLLSAIVNLLIWGVGFGLVRLFAYAMAAIYAGAGIYLGLLIYAVAPDKGQKAVVNSIKGMFAMCASSVVLGIVASLGCLFVNSGLIVLNVLDGKGNTVGGVLALSFSSIALPVLYLWGFKFLCVNIWKIGDPYSGNGLFKLIGGQAMANGLKTVAGAAITGAGALAGGMGLKDALGQMARGMGGPMARGGGNAVSRFLRAKDMAEGQRARRRWLDGNTKPSSQRMDGGSAADEAAVKNAAEQKSRREEILDKLKANPLNRGKSDEQLAAMADRQLEREGRNTKSGKKYSAEEFKTAYDNRRKRILEELRADPLNVGKSGRELAAMADERMASPKIIGEVEQAALEEHEKRVDAKLSGSNEYRRARAERRREIIDQLKRESGGDLSGRELAKRADMLLDSAENKRIISERALAASDEYSRLAADYESQTRQRLQAQGLEGTRLENAVKAEMSSDSVRQSLMAQTRDLFANRGTPAPDTLAARFQAQRKSGHGTLTSALVSGGMTAASMAANHPLLTGAAMLAAAPVSAPAAIATALGGTIIAHSALNENGRLHRIGTAAFDLGGQIATRTLEKATDIAARPHPIMNAVAGSNLGRTVGSTVSAFAATTSDAIDRSALADTARLAGLAVSGTNVNAAGVSDLSDPSAVATQRFGSDLTSQLVDAGMTGFAAAGIDQTVADSIALTMPDAESRHLANLGAQAVSNLAGQGLSEAQAAQAVRTQMTGLNLTDTQMGKVMSGARLAYRPSDSGTVAQPFAIDTSHSGFYGPYAQRAAERGITLEYRDSARFMDANEAMTDGSDYPQEIRTGAQMALNMVMHGDVTAPTEQITQQLRPQFESLGMSGQRLDAAMNAATRVLDAAPRSNADVSIPANADEGRYRASLDRAWHEREQRLRDAGVDGVELERQMRSFRADPSAAGLTQAAVVDYNSRVGESERLRFNPRVQRMEGNPNDVKAAQDLAVEQAASHMNPHHVDGSERPRDTGVKSERQMRSFHADQSAVMDRNSHVGEPQQLRDTNVQRTEGNPSDVKAVQDLTRF